MPYPKWVLKHKTKGTQIHKINNHYYLYKISSKWDPTIKRSKKVTEEYLGKITPDGVIPPKHKRPDLIISPPTVKEYGACQLFFMISEAIRQKLQEIFPKDYQMITVLSFLRAINPCPFKRLDHYYQHSYISEYIPDLSLSSKNISLFLRKLGGQRQQIVNFMNHFTSGTQHILFDVTPIFSQSKRMDINRLGYNRHKIYDPQINLLYAFSSHAQAPVYYRILPGNIRDISAFKLSIMEAGLTDATIVTDKGFGSEKNIELLDEQQLKYIIPLKRNSHMFDDSIIRSGDKANYQGHFLFEKRPIWFYDKKIDETKRVIVYLDEKLKAEEEKDYLQRLEKQIEGYSIANFYEKQFKFGTVAMIENTNKSCQDVFELFKSRDQIEKSFDMLKSTLDADTSYMQNEQALEAWAFLNHVSLIMLYQIYSLLKTNKLISKYSVTDLIEHLKYIHKIKINQQWSTSEINKKTNDLLQSLDLHIT